MGNCPSAPWTPKTSPNTLDRCVFCDIIAGNHPDSKKILYEDDHVLVFRDKSPAAVEHLQAVSRLHITNLDELRPSTEDHALVEELKARGGEVLAQLQPRARQKFGFHKPPFNSVHHLHLHCIALPHTPWWAVWKYTPLAPWWIGVKSALRQLKPAAGAAGAAAAGAATAAASHEPLV